MKALLPVLLVLLAAGAGAFFFLLDSERPGRGAKEAPRAEPVASTPETDTAPEPRAPSASRAPAPDPKRAGRQKVEALSTPASRAQFEGTVIGEGNPIPGASLELLRADQVLGEARTDEQGRFRLEYAPLATPVILRAHARGFVSLERSLTPKAVGGKTLLGNLHLQRGQRITGRVVDGRGVGVTDAQLRIEPTNPGTAISVAHGRSIPGGAFEIADAPPGTVSVIVRAAGFGERTVRYTPGPTPFEIRLEPGSELRLLIQTPRGRPVPDAVVTIQSTGDGRGTKYVKHSDEQGRVLFDGLGSPGWSVRVSHPEYQPIGRGQMHAGPGEQLLECKPWPAIEGVVRAPGGAAAPPGTRVVALSASAPADRAAQFGSDSFGTGAPDGGTEVASDGTFRLVGLRAGDWRVRATAPGFAPASSDPVKLGIEGDGFAGTIVLQAGARLTFTLTRATEHVAGAELELFQTEPAGPQLWALQSSRGPGLGRRVQSGADGRATFDSLLPGTVWVAIYAEGSPPLSSGPHEVGAENAPIAVELARGARVTGRVASAAGKASAGAQLRIVEGTLEAGSAGVREGQQRLGFPLILVADAEGRYTSAWLPPGRYTIEAFAPEDPTVHSGPSALDLGAGDQRTLDLTL